MSNCEEPECPIEKNHKHYGGKSGITVMIEEDSPNNDS